MKYYSYIAMKRRLDKIAYHSVRIPEIKEYLMDLGYWGEDEPTYKAQGLFYYNKGNIQWSELVVEEIENKFFEKI